MAISKGNLRRCLIQKFEFIEIPKTNHEAVSLVIGNRRVATAYFSRSWDNISEDMLGQIAGQLRIQKKELKQMYDCTRDREEYYEQLRRSGYLI